MPGDELAPFHVFRFRVEFSRDSLTNQGGGGALSLCHGSFSECTGLEATMEPKVIKEGGHNYGHNQRAGQVSFATVVLKRGMTDNRDLWNWFDLLTGGSYAYRMSVKIFMQDMAGADLLAWRLDKAMPIKFKGSDLNARNNEVGVEELHLAHEGLRLDD